jgi:polyhydroxyalkanoate synthesis regulator phasin
MRIPVGRKLIVGGVAALAVLGGGAALAATQLDSPSARSQAIINDAASQLGIQPGTLSDALKKAIEDQVDAAVKAGEITQQQGDAIKSRIESGDYPIFGGGLGFGPGLGFGRHGLGLFGDKLATAASYLGISESQLKSDLQSGKTLAQVANDQGKSVDGLVSTLVDAEKKQIEQAVTAGKLTRSQADKLESTLQQQITDLVNGTRPAPGQQHGTFGRGFRGGFGGTMWGGPGTWRGEQGSTSGGTTF